MYRSWSIKTMKMNSHGGNIYKKAKELGLEIGEKEINAIIEGAVQAVKG